ncbi:hypothetical protein NFI96_014009 [Prochilodus magdalenae]|nr:hypothetical protein NFI96_014009 [Prochilodus magdalenae]
MRVCSVGRLIRVTPNEFLYVLYLQTALIKMFAEEEDWADSLPAEDHPHVEVKTDSLGRKSKAISKRCLKRTLQTLGSVPMWESKGASDSSDGEVKEAPAHTNKKKKKRKKIADAGGKEEQHGQMDASEIPVKKRKKKQKPKEQGSRTSCELERDGNVKGPQKGKDDTTEKKLNRKQWRNRVKNKRRCKNKFLAPGGDGKANLKKEKIEQTQVSSKEEKNVGDPSPGRMKSEEKSDFVAAVNTHALENNKATKIKKKKMKDRESNGINRLQPGVEGSVCVQPKKANHVIPKTADPHEQCENQNPLKVDKNAELHTKKLKGQVTDSNTKLREEKQETGKTSKEEGKNPMDRSSALRLKMEKRLESARFRYINEQLYTSTSGEAKRMFKQDPDAIGVYHKGYTEQVKHWPANPVDSIISYIQQKSASLVVADFGCGDCKIARSVKNQVHCFDLAPVCDLVTACDMANVPLGNSTVDIAVFCLSLMGTNLTDFLAEANRVLVDGGVLKIAEVASRFDDIRPFTGALSRLGFKLVSKDTDNTHFYSFEFIKIQNAPVNRKKIGLQLKPCLYKKR